MRKAQMAIKVDRTGNYTRIGPAHYVSGTWCFHPLYKPTLTKTDIGIKRAITMWKNKTRTDKVIDANT